jgi:microcystin-dependent protein
VPLLLGRSLAVSGSGSGLTSFALGAATGTNNTTISQANLPNVNFPVTDPGHSHTYNESTGNNDGAGANLPGTVYTPTQTSTSTTGISVNSGGSGTAFSTMQPTSFLNVEIKL